MREYLIQKDVKRSSVHKDRIFFRWCLLLVSILLVAGVSAIIVRFFQNSIWDGIGRFTFVMTGKDKNVRLLSYSPSDRELALITIPENTYLEVTHGYGRYQIGSVPGLEALEKRKDLLVESLQENFGVPVDGWIEGSGKNLSDPPVDKTVEDGKGKIDAKTGGDEIKTAILGELQKQILGTKETDLSRWDLARLFWQIKNLRFDKVKLVDLKQLGVLSDYKLPDSTKVLGVNFSVLDGQLQNQTIFSEPKIRQEGLSMEVLNGTDHLGLAERGARLISNIGGDVIWVGNSDQRDERCKIESGSNNRTSYTVLKISKVFDCQWQERKEAGRADVTIILSESYYRKLTVK